jgi:GNAT superfamily N-acetyltransferase
MPLTIRPATPEDAPTLVAYQLLMARETEDLKLDVAVITRGVQGVFDEPTRGTYWVAERDGAIVGGLLTTPEWSDWRAGTILWIQSVYVVPAERGRGVLRALYAHLHRLVRESDDLCGLRLYVDRRNLVAQQAYERLGMSREHYHTYEWLKE